MKLIKKGGSYYFCGHKVHVPAAMMTNILMLDAAADSEGNAEIGYKLKNGEEWRMAKCSNVRICYVDLPSGWLKVAGKKVRI